jgi:uroporphyrinogen decarboxylase
MSAMEGKKTDRRAVSLTLPMYGARLTGCPLKEYYSDPRAYARGQAAVRETFGPDVLFGPFGLALEGSAFGSQVKYLEKQAPNLAYPAVTSLKDIVKVDLPDIESHPVLTFFRESIRIMAKEHGDEVPILAICLSPADLPAMILGIEGWIDTLLFSPDGVNRVLDITIPFFVKWINALIGEGATAAVLPMAFSNPTVVTREIARDITISALRVALPEISCPVLIHSAGASLSPFIDLFVGLENVAGFVLNGRDSFSAAREKVGPEPLLIGNIDGPTLYTRNGEDVFRECMEVLEDRKGDPRFILGSSAADIAYETPLESIRAFREAAEAFEGRNYS